jgi:DegV family protein with EDD domain
MSTNARVGIVTDSTADIPPDMLESLQIVMIPALLIIDGKTYEDGGQLSRSDFYNGLPDYRQPPTTATPSPALFGAAYRGLFEEGIEHVFSIHVASKLSAMFSAASQAAQAFPEKVRVIDSGQLTLGLGFQVIEAAQAALHGQTVEQIQQTIESARRRVRVAALINTLEYLRRSGRVSWMRAGVGDLLQIKQLLSVSEGAIHALGKARTFGRALQELIQIGRSWGMCQRMAILHTGIAEMAERVSEIMKDQSATPLRIIEVTTIIGAHVGPGAIGLAGLTT